MLGFNGGRIGVVNTTSLFGSISGMWSSMEQVVAKRSNIWVDIPYSSPQELQDLGAADGFYVIKSSSMSSPILFEYKNNYYENKSWVCVFRSPYRSPATTNRINLNIPMGGLLVQRDALDHRAAVYWNTNQSYNTTTSNTANSGYSPRKVMLGGGGSHGIYTASQTPCNWNSATGAIGAGFDGSNCGSFPNNLVWGTGSGSGAGYANRSGTWSHWVYWS